MWRVWGLGPRGEVYGCSGVMYQGCWGRGGGRLKRCICGIGCNNTEKLWMLGSSILGIGGRGEERKLIKYAVGGPCDD